MDEKKMELKLTHDLDFSGTFELPVQEFPLKVSIKGDRQDLILAIFGGVVFIAISYEILNTLMVSNSHAVPGIIWFFFLVSLIFFLIFFDQCLSIITYKITATRIAKYERSLLWGTVDWEEDVKNYKGVLMRVWQVKKTGRATLETLYIIELTHSNPDKRVKLLQANSTNNLREKWQMYCMAFALPAFIEREQGSEIVAHDFEIAE
ncbi:hypothetical protein ACFL35_13655 [Candidatus Riflebacteria bacterium]